ncbi:LTMD1-like protein [Mya arenaria]|uniref:LTMD1-like protein n=1 Tax=Mya arenaria TaxID=6604 RepID=A0ABY7EPN5_MYAAR|nr:LTMD1-like protein [Mya arenaria]
MINMQAFCLRTEYILRNGHKLKCLRWHPSLRCLSTDPPHDPKDTIGPPTKLWRYVVKSLKKLVETSEKKLEKNLPKVLREIDHIAYRNTEGAIRDSIMTILDKRLLSKVNSLRKSREKLEQDCLITLHIDRAMVKEGIDDMQDTEMCRACLKRGLNPYGLSREERIKFLQAWTTISQNLDEKGLSLLLHCPVFLTYNAPTNINLMKGKRYKWRRISPV